MTADCSCDDAAPVIPKSPSNRPGLDTLAYRIGTHASFLEAMRTSAATFQPRGEDAGEAPLATLDLRNTNDMALALLDGCAMIADVIAFYEERIANEGYLRTAREKCSLQSLASTIGYEPKRGVAASVYLAYDVEDARDADVQIPVSSRVQSTPESGALPQTFETSVALIARQSWNRLPVKLSQPQSAPTSLGDPLYLAGVATDLKPNDPLLLVQADGTIVGDAPLYVAGVEPDFAGNRTRVDLQGSLLTFGPPVAQATVAETLQQITAVTRARPMRTAASTTNPLAMPASNASLQSLTAFDPSIRRTLYSALASTASLSPSSQDPTSSAQLIDFQVIAFRVRAAPFGNNAPLQPVFNDKSQVTGYREWTLERASPVSGATEDFQINVSFNARSHSDEHPPLGFVVASRIGSHGTQTGTIVPPEVSVTIEDKAADETIVVTLSLEQANFGIELRKRKVSITLRLGKDQEMVVAEEGANPISVTGFAVGRLSPDIRTPDALFRAFAAQEATRDLLKVNGSVLEPTLDSVPTETNDHVSLDAAYDKIVSGSWVVVDRPSAKPGDAREIIMTRVDNVTLASRADYGVTGRTTRLGLGQDWLHDVTTEDFSKAIRGTTVYAQSEVLARSEAPVSSYIAGDTILLDGLFADLPDNRTMILEGETVGAADNVRTAEVITVAQVLRVADAQTPRHTKLQLTSPLAGQYKPATVTLYGNVVRATQGESRSEVLGSGDSSQPSLALPIHQGPLTYVSATNARGASTLQVRVNGVLWHEADSLHGLGPTDRRYVTRPLDDGRVTVVFGNGVRGARPSTGSANIQAVYRTGLGRAGNVSALKVNQAVSRPLGVKAVVNPLPASGADDPEGAGSIRRNAPLASMALDRLVSTSDYADYARSFAGVGKAVAQRLSTQSREAVSVTLTSADASPLLESSDVLANLAAAYTRLGDPLEPVHLMPAEMVHVTLQANVRVLPDYLWTAVEPAIRLALLDAFGFDHRDFGQDLALSDVISTIQRVEGVDAVDVDAFGSVTEQSSLAAISGTSSGPPSRPVRDVRIHALLARLGAPVNGTRPVLPARIVFITANASSNVKLTEQKA